MFWQSVSAIRIVLPITAGSHEKDFAKGTT